MTALGPIFVDLAGLTIEADEKQRLQHPLVGGVILFTRNYANPEQLRQLVAQIKALRESELLVAVDHEGGRVQRFREGFTRLPAMRTIGEQYAQNKVQGLHLAQEVAWLMASELRESGIDFSFAPVLDLDRGVSSVIGDRAFHASAEAVTELAKAWIEGMHEAGMPCVAKHFPGHGAVEADSHLALPVDTRPLEAIAEDLAPFNALSQTLDAVMPAHVIYSQLDSNTAGFSAYWLQTVLREKLGFKGVVISDDLSMAAAESGGSPVERAQAALDAGCDILLVCNQPEAAEQVLQGLQWQQQTAVAAMRAKSLAVAWDSSVIKERQARVQQRLASLSAV